MGEDGKHSMRGLGVSSLCLQEKKGWRCVCVCVHSSRCVYLPLMSVALMDEL